MSAKARFTKADVKRAVSGVASAGYRIEQVEIELDGTIRVIVDGGSRRQPKGWSGLE